MFEDIFLTILSGGSLIVVTGGALFLKKLLKLASTRTDTQIAVEEQRKVAAVHQVKMTQHQQDTQLLAITAGDTSGKGKASITGLDDIPEVGRIDSVESPTDTFKYEPIEDGDYSLA